MIQLQDAERGTTIGAITEEQFDLLAQHLEEESLADRDYYIAGATIDMLEERGLDPEVVAMLRGALAGREGFDVRWTRG